MILDTSAVVGVVIEEPGWQLTRDALADATVAGMGTPTLAETGVVLTGKVGPNGAALLAQFVQAMGLISIPFGDDHWREAVSAHRRYGKGRHAAGLNLGDCMAYAVARLADEPLLTLNEGFRLTDLELVLPQA